MVGSETVNKVEILHLMDGFRVIRKSPRRANLLGSATAKRQYDAEELGGAVARAVGLKAPETYRDADDSIYMDYVENAKLSMDAKPEHIHNDDWEEEKAKTADGVRLGLLDLLTFNYDRHNANWFITDAGQIIPIDHGQSWGGVDVVKPSRPPMNPQNRFERRFTYNPWDEGIETDDDEEDSRWVPSSPVSQASMRALRPKLEAMEPEFRRLGRLDWYRAMMARYEVLLQRAYGKVEL